jgi:hypothetical protein
MAPEQAPKQMVDRRIDLYNFDVTMDRRFTGRYALQGILIPDGVSFGTLVPPIAINRKIPGSLNETIPSCLEVNRERRPAGTFKIKHQLNAMAKSLSLSKSNLKGSDDEHEEPLPEVCTKRTNLLGRQGIDA